MKRSLLFIGYDAQVEQEIRESLCDKVSECFFVQTPVDAIRTVDDHAVDCVVLNFSAFSDASLIRYFGQYHPGIRLVLSASREFDEVISIFSESTYSRLPRPFRLEQLREII